MKHVLRITGIIVSGAVIALALTTADQASAKAPKPERARTDKSAKKNKGKTNKEEKKQTELSRRDRKFIEKAAMANMFEVQMGKIASKRAAKAEVKGFGRRMIVDHSAAQKQLAKLASAKKIEMPKKLNWSARRAVKKLSKLTGSKFDKSYMDLMVKDHHGDVTAFQRYLKKSGNEKVMVWATTTLPVLQAHEALARQIQARMQGVAGR